MSERLLDDLARGLARPMSRRRSLAVFGGGMAAVMLPPVRARRAGAQFGGSQICTPATEDCRQTECPQGLICCVGPDDPSTVTTCPVRVSCCDPCDPRSSRCMSDGRCGPGEPGCKDECCRRIGQGACCGELCCTEDQVCDKSRGICCPPDPDAPKCNEPTPECKKQVDDRINTQKLFSCGSGAAGPNSAAPGAAGALDNAVCLLMNDVVSRYQQYEKCAQVPDDRNCAAGGRCDGGTMRCSQCRDNSRATVRAAGREPADLAEGPAPAIAVASAQRVSRKELARRFARRKAVRDRKLDRLLELAAAPRYAAHGDDALAAAIGAYRREVVRLRASLSRGRGGAPQRYALSMCDELAAGLKRFQVAAGTADRDRAQRQATSGKTQVTQALRRARRMPKVVGCGDRCL